MHFHGKSDIFQPAIVAVLLLASSYSATAVLSASTASASVSNAKNYERALSHHIHIEEESTRSSRNKQGWHQSKSKKYDLLGMRHEVPTYKKNVMIHREQQLPSSQWLEQQSRTMIMRGGGTTAAVVAAKKSRNVKESSPPSSSTGEFVSWSRRDLALFQSSSFLIVLSLTIVGFSPAPTLIAKLGSERATSTLSILSACAALTQIVISPTLGSLLDSMGRKPALILTLLSIGLVNGAVSLHSSVFTICMAKFVGTLCIGLFFIASEVIVSDICASSPEKMGSTLGVQYALIGGAFFVGAIGAGWLSEFGLSVIYGVSTIVAFLTTLLVTFGITETLLPSKKIALQGAAVKKQLLESPLSCTRILFRHTKEVRVLALLLMVQSLPAFMGDTFQILAKTEWNLGTKDFSSFVAMFGIINIAANVVGSQMVVKLGIKKFTAFATLSAMLSPLGASFFSFRGLIVGSIMGFLGSAQMLGVTAALVAEGTKSGIPQGELAGERSSFLALMKVIGPIWYSMLYVKGKKFLGVGSLPFLFNAILAMIAFGISQYYL